ncbi:MAG TPA: mannitol dehydrogenase family protein [Humibacter sp.]|nr:mannitol dehydrogenase family protein [Humibacter sp.]
MRIVHLGLGAFHRSHQAWYTARANEAAPGDPWGIAAFTGRSPQAADDLGAQDGLFTLITRAADGDRAEIVGSISAAVDGADAVRWRELIAAPSTAILTITITERGYCADADGRLDQRLESVRDDLRLLRSGAAGAVQTAPGRIVDGLRARRAAGGAPIAIVSCDNLAGNGELCRAVVLELARAVDADLAGWAASAVSFVSTMVDRITPATAAEDVAEAAELTGYADAVPVVAEPFAEWVLAGEFPAGRPAWESAGALFVDDVAPYEQRKLWLLNAGHSLLAYLGLLRGHDTIAAAMADPNCIELLERLWAEAAECLPFGDAEIAATTRTLRARFANPRIRHLLSQIASDGSAKLPVRVVPVLRERREAGRAPGAGQAALVAAWMLHLGGPGHLVQDAGAAGLRDRLSGEAHADAAATLDFLDPVLGADPALVSAVADAAFRLSSPSENPEGKNP